MMSRAELVLVIPSEVEGPRDMSNDVPRGGKPGLARFAAALRPRLRYAALGVTVFCWNELPSLYHRPHLR
jgi:hypothetical protein